MLTVLTFLAAAATNPSLTKPRVPVMPTLTNADCADPKVRNAKVAAINGDEGFGDTGERFNADWQAYLDARLDKLGMSAGEKAQFMEDILESKEFQDLQAKNEALMKEMTSDFDTLGETRDEAAQCRIVARMLGFLVPMTDNANRQWEHMDSQIIAEAKRRGITLDN